MHHVVTQKFHAPNGDRFPQSRVYFQARFVITRVLIGLLLAMGVLITRAQSPSQAVSVHLSPVPLAPGGKIPDSLNGEFVYLDPESQEIIVVPDTAASGAKPVVFELHNRATPLIASKVTAGASGTYVYDYASCGSLRIGTGKHRPRYCAGIRFIACLGGRPTIRAGHGGHYDRRELPLRDPTLRG